MTFQKGQSGNPLGRKNGTLATDALRTAANRLYPDPDGGKKKKTALKIAATKIVEKAMAGDLPCFQEISNRLDGKVAQRIEGSLEVSASDAHLQALQELTQALRDNPAVDVTPVPAMIEHESDE